MKHIAEAITRLLVKNDIITSEQAEVYSYGLMLILTSGTTTFVILLYGILTHRLIMTIGFLLALTCLRHYTGGYHAKTYWRCFICSCTFYFIGLWSLHDVYHLLPLAVVVIGSWMLSGYLCYVGSLNSTKQPKTPDEMKKRKKCARVLSLLFSVITTAICLVEQEVTPIAWLLFYVQAITAFCILIEFLKRGCSYEENSFKGNC